jgi:hypothetical protein
MIHTQQYPYTFSMCYSNMCTTYLPISLF